ncbi:secreted protein, partial [Candidatus Thiomargarita nelsonii]
MLKKAIAMSIALPMSIGLGPSASAAETGGLAGFSASVGLKAWVNEWDVPSDELNQIISFRSESEVVLIPVLSFRYNNFFISGSYFPETDYSLGEQTIFGEFDVAEQGAVAQLQYGGLLTKLSAERSEWDINVGYYLSPFL